MDKSMSDSGPRKKDGLRVAIEGCGHGTLDEIYKQVDKSRKERGWDDVDIVIICGDFQAVRNGDDLTAMSVPAKYRELGDFAKYYRGDVKAPYLTIFIGGNHEASSHLWELYYGGWVAPNIYYLGASNVIRYGPLRIAGMSGIWKGSDYHKSHYERLPFSYSDVRSIYHVREFEVRKLLLLREQVDIGLSHDWPRGIDKFGDLPSLLAKKTYFVQESNDGVLGSPAAQYVMDRLRPAYWFSAHLHCKYAALKQFDPPSAQPESDLASGPAPVAQPEQSSGNPDEIDLEDGDDNEPVAQAESGETRAPATIAEPQPSTGNPDEIDLDDGDDGAPVLEAADAKAPAPSVPQPAQSAILDELRAQLPASFAAPPKPKQKLQPGQPVPPSIANTATRFLSLDKCLGKRHFLQLMRIGPIKPPPKNLSLTPPLKPVKPRKSTVKANYVLQYDPEWLAITRVFSSYLTIGDRSATPPPDLGEEAYHTLIDEERRWVDEHIVNAGKLAVPYNFQITAPPHVPGTPINKPKQPNEYTNPQTVAFCRLLEIENPWDATPEERAQRMANAPPVEMPGQDQRGGGNRGGYSRGGGGHHRGGGHRGGPRGVGGGGRGARLFSTLGRMIR